MPTLMTIEGTVEQGLLIRDALCANHNYLEMIADPNNIGEEIPNPESKTDFAKRMLLAFLKRQVKIYRENEVKATLAAAVEQAEAEADGIGVA